MSAPMTHQETVYGWLYLFIQLFILPTVLQVGNRLLPHPFSAAELNFIFFLLNFLAVICIFHRFLGKSGRKMTQHPMYFLQAVVLGLAAYLACTWLFDQLISWFRPGFLNLNDRDIAAMARSGKFLMVIGTVVLVPPVEECFYRGLIFRNLYSKNTWCAYLLSMAAFSAIHVVSFAGRLSWIDFIICFVQYLPAGLCLAWAYQKADTIYAPILIHALINLRGIYTL